MLGNKLFGVVYNRFLDQYNGRNEQKPWRQGEIQVAKETKMAKKKNPKTQPVEQTQTVETATIQPTEQTQPVETATIHPAEQTNGVTGTVVAENNGVSHETTNEVAPKTPVETEENTGFMRTPGGEPQLLPPVQQAASPQEKPVTETLTAPTQAVTTPASPPVVPATPVQPPVQHADSIARLTEALEATKAEITAITATIDAEQNQLDQRKEALDAAFESRKSQLEQKRNQLIEALQGAGVPWEGESKPKAKRGRPGRKPGSVAHTTAPKQNVQPAKRGRGRRSDGPSSRDLIVALVFEADGPVPLKDIRNYLRENNKLSNPSMETKRLCEDGILKRNREGDFIPGKK